MAFEFIQQTLAQRQQQQLLRRRYALSGCGRYVSQQQRSYLNFSSNDYLALATEPQVIHAATDALAAHGVGSGGSALVTGYHSVHQQLEQQLCDWLGFERCLLFNSGFAANTALLYALMDRKDAVIVQDKLNHASLMEAASQVKAQHLRFAHNDLDQLATRLQQSSAVNKLVITEGVFSMDGDRADIAQCQQLCQQHSAWLMVDDAHGVGVLGEQGRGSVQANQAQIQVVTFGKALGTSGAAIGGSAELIDYLIQCCRHYIYSTAMPVAIAAATSASIDLIRQQPQRQQKLQQLIAHFQRRQRQIGLTPLSDTAIQPIVIGDAADAVAISEGLKQQGIWLTAIRPPTVPVGSSRLRVTLTCHQQLADIDQLFDKLSLWIQ